MIFVTHIETTYNDRLKAGLKVDLGKRSTNYQNVIFDRIVEKNYVEFLFCSELFAMVSN